jgi:hypothetical protein
VEDNKISDQGDDDQIWSSKDNDEVEQIDSSSKVKLNPSVPDSHSRSFSEINNPSAGVNANQSRSFSEITNVNITHDMKNISQI